MNRKFEKTSETLGRFHFIILIFNSDRSNSGKDNDVLKR